MNKPLLSIITVTYNAEKLLEGTILSVIGQEIKRDYEFILIDGKSTDRTLEIAKKYANHFALIHSEKDAGIYDAMNKGIQFSTGQYLLFLNAGDHLNEDVLAEILDKLKTSPDVLYSDTINVNAQYLEIGLRSIVGPHALPKKLSWKDYQKGMVVCHQSFISKKDLSPKFDLTFRLSSDQDWCIKVLKNSKNIQLLNKPISKYLIEGISTKYWKQSLSERFWIYVKHFGFFTTLFNHFIIGLRHFSRKFKM
ncbi:MAG: putative glycosyltransferase [Bacteroidota bacterium]|jgi:glycosyltransferase involved in cell wall biosynthesis